MLLKDAEKNSYVIEIFVIKFLSVKLAHIKITIFLHLNQFTTFVIISIQKKRENIMTSFPKITSFFL